MNFASFSSNHNINISSCRRQLHILLTIQWKFLCCSVMYFIVNSMVLLYVDQYSMYINCGGSATTIGNITYEADNDLGGSAKFFHENENWGFSSTGHFWDVETSRYDYIADNVSILTMNESELYTRARLSPLSFTYYARCLAKGTYKVKLHFAEIVIGDNRSFYSLGRWIFDIYVQVFYQIYFSLCVIVEELIELIFCRKNWCGKILILKVLQEGLIRLLLRNIKQMLQIMF